MTHPVATLHESRASRSISHRSFFLLWCNDRCLARLGRGGRGFAPLSMSACGFAWLAMTLSVDRMAANAEAKIIAYRPAVPSMGRYLVAADVS